ncbi:putative gag domain protein [Burkholderia pseudomallei MSHR5609]|nr:putative gag domain protein [Burkholderia pseudomallei MSHR5609]
MPAGRAIACLPPPEAPLVASGDRNGAHRDRSHTRRGADGPNARAPSAGPSKGGGNPPHAWRIGGMAARPSGERIAPAGRCQEKTAVRPVRGLRHKGFGLGCHKPSGKKMHVKT